MKRIATLAIVLGLLVAAPLSAQPLPPPDPIAQLSRLGPIVYITAHPDDESGPILTYLARGLHARVVLLPLTRGEGGQNQTGPELGEELAAIRTRETERAAAAYGVELRFLGAEDFGYSKSVEETYQRWDEEKLLAELVAELRRLRPTVVISNWTGTEQDGGGSHHQAAGALTRRAFALMGDPRAFPEQLQQGLEAWQPRFLLIRSRTAGPEASGAPAVEVPVTQPSPVPGKSFEDLGWDGFRNHRSQGMERSDFSWARGRRYFLRVEATLRQGPPAPETVAGLVPDLSALPEFFPAVEFLKDWRERLAQAASLAGDARRLAAEKPAEAALALVQGAGLLAAVRREIPEGLPDREPRFARAMLADKENDFLRAAAELAGVELQAFSDRAAVSPGERVWVGLAVRVGAPEVFRAVGFEIAGLRLDTPAGWDPEPLSALTTAESKSIEYLVRIPTRPAPAPWGTRVLRARAALRARTLEFELAAPVRGLAAPTAANARPGILQRLDPRRLLGRQAPPGTESSGQLEPVRLAPPLTLTIEPALRLLPAAALERTREWCVTLEANRPELGRVSLWYDVPLGWFTPLPQETTLSEPGQRARLCSPLTLPGDAAPGRYELKALAGRGLETFKLTERQQFAGNGEPAFIYTPAAATIELLDLAVPAGLRVGFIGFDTDPLPKILSELGVTVDLLDSTAFGRAQLSLYDTVIVAPRAYDYRDDLAEATPRLLDYVEAGGTLLVEPQGYDWDPAKFAPYPGVKPPNRNLRVTDETAPVRVLDPDHSVLNFPNRIGADDWKGWVHERGLFFWESWAEDYTPLLAMADPGEEPLRGGLLYARYGDGAYIYSGLSLYRQARAGVAGGVRLYINLLSQSRALKAAAAAGRE
jgi:LmbE family N-acetylglucosaminyl deacetylase